MWLISLSLELGASFPFNEKYSNKETVRLAGGIFCLKTLREL